MKTLLIDKPSIIHEAPHVLESIIHGDTIPAKHFRKEVDHDGIAWLTFDSPKSSANVWNEETLREFNHNVEVIEHDTRVRALVLRSAKDRIFVAGADLKSIRSMPHARVNDLIWLGQAVFDRLARLKLPKIVPDAGPPAFVPEVKQPEPPAAAAAAAEPVAEAPAAEAADAAVAVAAAEPAAESSASEPAAEEAKSE
jgi:hypothetical protein